MMCRIPFRALAAALALLFFAMPAARAYDNCIAQCLLHRIPECAWGYETQAMDVARCGGAESDCRNECAARRARYGAIAYSRSSGATGWSYTLNDDAGARDEAMFECAKSAPDCEIVISFANSCGAVAVGKNSIPVPGQGPSREVAERAARAVCAVDGGKDCNIVAWSCSFP